MKIINVVATKCYKAMDLMIDSHTFEEFDKSVLPPFPVTMLPVSEVYQGAFNRTISLSRPIAHACNGTKIRLSNDAFHYSHQNADRIL